MREETQLHLSTAITGLVYSGDRIGEALLGETRGYDTSRSQNGPFARALTRMAEIADGGEITDLEAARKDMLYLFGLLPLLQGGFYDSAWRILGPAHARVADRIPADFAEAILGVGSEYMLDIEVKLGHLHRFDEQDPETERYSYQYAAYEVKALRAKRDAAHAPYKTGGSV